MKRISTAAANEVRNISRGKLTVELDLGDRSSWYCVLDESGRIVLEQRMSTAAKALRETFGSMPCSRIALETAMHSP
jgi:transposase